MKIALAQQNYHIGNIRENTKKIIDSIELAKKDNAELIVFSELAICGYTPLDLLNRHSFIENINSAISKICKHSIDIGIIIGTPTQNNSGQGLNLFNSALFIYNGEIVKTINKTLLPCFDIFDENKYFEPNSQFEIIEFKGNKIALTIAEDLWDKQKICGKFNEDLNFNDSPLSKLIEKSPDFIINISAIPFRKGNDEFNDNILKSNSIKYSIPIVYTNQVGANTEIIYNGGSKVLNSKGETVVECNYFKEDLKYVDTNAINTLNNIKTEKRDNIKDIYSALVLGIKDYFLKSGFTKAVIGLSGGIDSALTVALAIQALGKENVEVILMPTIYSSNHSVDDSIKMAEICKIKYHIINIDKIRKCYDESLASVFAGREADVAEENIQARIRGTLLMAFSNKFGNIVLNTSNKSEEAVGYSTLYGDMVGAISVLGDVYKTEVYEISNYINNIHNNIIPENIITKEPSAELRPNQKDSDSLPDYDILDKILYYHIELDYEADQLESLGIDRETIERTIKLINNNEHKRYQAPPILKVSSKSFGYGRKLPIVAQMTDK